MVATCSTLIQSRLIQYLYMVNVENVISHNDYDSYVWIGRIADSRAPKEHANQIVLIVQASKETPQNFVATAGKTVEVARQLVCNTVEYAEPVSTLQIVAIDENVIKNLKSGGKGISTSCSFTNASDQAVKVYWKDYAGVEKEWFTVNGGNTTTITSYLEHLWCCRIEGKLVHYYVVESSGKTTIPKQKYQLTSTAIENNTETSCYDLIKNSALYPRTGWKDLCFVQNDKLFTALESKLQSKKFIDEEFPPKKGWVRATELFKVKGCAVFKNGITPSDVQQGNIGNCWLMQCIASVAQFPDKIEKIFYKYNVQAGIYMLSLFYNGTRVLMLLDDYFAVTNDSLTYSHAIDGEIWVPLLEKAFAKIVGGYANMPGHVSKLSPSDALVFMANGKAQVFSWAVGEQLRNNKPIDRPALWNRLVDIRKQGAICVVSSRENLDGAFVNSKGLVTYHGYSVLDVKTFNNDTLKLLCIRNTWGKVCRISAYKYSY